MKVTFLLIPLPMLIVWSTNSIGFDLTPHFAQGQSPSVMTDESTTVTTHERIVEFDGEKYQEVDYKTEKYFFRFRDKEPPLQDSPECITLSSGTGPEKIEPYRVTAQVEVTSRTAVFIEGLRTHCQKVERLSDFNLGISKRDKDNKTKSISINPLTQRLELGSKDQDGSGKTINVSPTGGSGVGMTW